MGEHQFGKLLPDVVRMLTAEPYLSRTVVAALADISDNMSHHSLLKWRNAQMLLPKLN